MNKNINENTIVTIYEVIMDYIYIWGLIVPITKALEEISKKQKEEERTATYHICVGENSTDRICSIAMNNIRFDEDMCIPDVKTVCELLTRNGNFEFKVSKETWSLRKSMIYSGIPKDKVDKLLNN